MSPPADLPRALPPETTSALADGTVHILSAALDSPPVPIPGLLELLADAERARAARYVHQADAHRHIIARGLARIVLGRLTGTPAAGLRLQTTPEGKPFLPGGPSFSIAHSGPLVLLAFAAEGRLGVDAEASRALSDLPGLARTAFRPEECQAVLELSEPERTAAFFRVWTRKEALLKALGSGLAALQAITVACTPGEANALLRIEPPEQAASWTVRSLPVEPAVPAAVAWDRPLLRVQRFQL